MPEFSRSDDPPHDLDRAGVGLVSIRADEAREVDAIVDPKPGSLIDPGLPNEDYGDLGHL